MINPSESTDHHKQGYQFAIPPWEQSSIPNVASTQGPQQATEDYEKAQEPPYLLNLPPLYEDDDHDFIPPLSPMVRHPSRLNRLAHAIGITIAELIEHDSAPRSAATELTPQEMVKHKPHKFRGKEEQMYRIVTGEVANNSLKALGQIAAGTPQDEARDSLAYAHNEISGAQEKYKPQPGDKRRKYEERYDQLRQRDDTSLAQIVGLLHNSPTATGAMAKILRESPNPLATAVRLADEVVQWFEQDHPSSQVLASVVNQLPKQVRPAIYAATDVHVEPPVASADPFYEDQIAFTQTQAITSGNLSPEQRKIANTDTAPLPPLRPTRIIPRRPGS